MPVHPLNDAEFRATFVAPMRLLDETEEIAAVDLRAYVRECFDAQGLAVAEDDVVISAVYVSADARFTHVMLSYGQANRFLVIVVDNVAAAIPGYHWLDLNQQYGLASNTESTGPL